MKLPNQPSPSRLTLFLAIAALLMTVSGAAACNIPVFRYALENWAPDVFEIIVFHRGPLDEAQQKLVDQLRAEAVPDGTLNIKVDPLDVSGALDEANQQILEQEKPPAFPWIVLRYPSHTKQQGTAWSGPLNEKNVQSIIDSPLRKEIVRQLVAGESAVFVFVESGNKSADEEVYNNLNTLLNEMQKILKLPPTDPADPEAQPGGRSFSAIVATSPLRLSFSILRVRRDQVEEEILLALLNHSEAALASIQDKPMAFPIFGRGRVLYAMAGIGIDRPNVGQACSFLTGACSCQVKEQNPGVDMLMKADWINLLTQRFTPEATAPELTGSAALISPASQPSVETQPVPPPQSPASAKGPGKTVFLSIAAAVAVLLLAGFVLARRNPLMRK